MKYVTMFLIVAQLVGCASQPRMTKFSSPIMRVLVNPQGIDSSAYVRIENALVESQRWFVVDRSSAFKAAIEEQNMSRISYPTRFSDTEKYARLGKLFGCGGVVQANLHCVQRNSFWHGNYVHCYENLVLINTSTAEIIASAEAEADPEPALWNSPQGSYSPDWSNVVEKLNQNIPANYEMKYTKEMQEFREVVKEESQREEESR